MMGPAPSQGADRAGAGGGAADADEGAADGGGDVAVAAAAAGAPVGRRSRHRLLPSSFCSLSSCAA